MQRRARSRREVTRPLRTLAEGCSTGWRFALSPQYHRTPVTHSAGINKTALEKSGFRHGYIGPDSYLNQHRSAFSRVRCRPVQRPGKPIAAIAHRGHHAVQFRQLTNLRRNRPVPGAFPLGSTVNTTTRDRPCPEKPRLHGAANHARSQLKARNFMILERARKHFCSPMVRFACENAVSKGNEYSFSTIGHSARIVGFNLGLLNWMAGYRAEAGHLLISPWGGQIFRPGFKSGHLWPGIKDQRELIKEYRTWRLVWPSLPDALSVNRNSGLRSVNIKTKSQIRDYVRRETYGPFTDQWRHEASCAKIGVDEMAFGVESD